MKKVHLLWILLLWTVAAHAEKFQFALFTDLHISQSNKASTEDLRAVIEDVNMRNEVDFVLIDGDITETGDRISLEKAKSMLDSLNVPYYAVGGNHETKWSESGATDITRVFGDDKFAFTHKGIFFGGFTTGPVIKMGDGHIAPQDIEWLKGELSKLPTDYPAIICTHYPLQTGDVDNWYDMTDMLRKYNVQAILNGHYHRNLVLNYDGICGIVNRSTQRHGKAASGYSIVEIGEEIRVFEQNTNAKEKIEWFSIPLTKQEYGEPDSTLRPSYAVNKEYPQVKTKWEVALGIGIYASPCLYKNKVYIGDDLGNFYCLNALNGKTIWKKTFGSRIISSAAADNEKVVFGSTNGSIYCLNSKNGEVIWEYKTSKAVLGCPIIEENVVYIGGSDGCFRGIDLNNGTLVWEYNEVKNYIETKPVIYQEKIYFGAWDSYLYALNKANGSLAWKWNNGAERIHFSPAVVHPVVAYGKIFISAPDRYWTALDAETGKMIWRTNKHMVRETMGISEDKNTVYSRCMNDSVVAIDATSNRAEVKWKTSADYGYDHNPSMLIEKGGLLVFGTKNGLIHGIDAENGEVIWRHKIGNSIVNTIATLSKHACIVSTSEGTITRLEY